MKRIHDPVLLEETLALLNLKSGDMAIDGTLDGGGHAETILQCIYPGGKVLGIEQDADMVEFIERRKKEEGGIWKALIVHHGNFRNIVNIAKKYNLSPNAILFDLGISRWHYTESGRGFSFRNPDEPLSMALEDASETKRAAAELLNYASREELADIFFDYGEERRSRQIANAIVEHRKKKLFYTVGDLLDITNPLLSKGAYKKNPSTKIFQAIRIAVNDELQNLINGLAGSWEIIKNGGRIGIVSYHSLEDRIVKNFFKDLAYHDNGNIITKKPVIATRQEILKNPSARSAKLRVIEKTQK
ncbi:MAG: 16S rRNA (cytosine(1402)-N(4))-methyltransferase RsmH [Patescibacteria group bacterium]